MVLEEFQTEFLAKNFFENLGNWVFRNSELGFSVLHKKKACVDPCSSGLALQTLHTFLDLESQGDLIDFIFH